MAAAHARHPPLRLRLPIPLARDSDVIRITGFSGKSQVVLTPWNEPTAAAQSSAVAIEQTVPPQHAPAQVPSNASDRVDALCPEQSANQTEHGGALTLKSWAACTRRTGVLALSSQLPGGGASLRIAHLRHERAGPAAGSVDDFVDLAHDAEGLADGDDDLLVVRNRRPSTSSQSPVGHAGWAVWIKRRVQSRFARQVPRRSGLITLHWR